MGRDRRKLEARFGTTRFGVSTRSGGNPPPYGFLQTEDGFYILQETGDKFIKEQRG